MGKTRLIDLARAAIITGSAAVNGYLITHTHNPIVITLIGANLVFITYFIATLMTDWTEQP